MDRREWSITVGVPMRRRRRKRPIPAPAEGKQSLPGQLSISPREQCHDFRIGAMPIGSAALFVVVVGAMAFR
jgi:hypothetical protein